MRSYGALVRAARTIAHNNLPIRRIDASLLDPGTNAEFVFGILGGRIRPDANTTARISNTGEVTYSNDR